MRKNGRTNLPDGSKFFSVYSDLEIKADEHKFRCPVCQKNEYMLGEASYKPKPCNTLNRIYTRMFNFLDEGYI